MVVGKSSLSKVENKCKSGCIAPGGKEFVMMEKPLAEVVVENGIRARVEGIVKKILYE